ncbi:MAG: YfhO family protein [Chitinispirillia bacterium]|jgi:hypothetical protein
MAKRKKQNKVSLTQPEKIKNTGQISQFQLKTWHYILGLGILCSIFYYRIILGIGNFWEDLIYQEFPHRVFARDSFLSLNFPHWNPYTFNGMPFFSAIHTGVLYPFNVLLSFIPCNYSVFWYLLEMTVVSHIFFAGVSMFLYMKHRNVNKQSAFFAAIGYMFCGFFITHIMHSLMLYILAWLPLILLLIERGLKTAKWVYFSTAGAILGLTIFAGHPQITFYEFLFLGSYSLYTWYTMGSKRNIISLVYIGLTFFIAVGIGMIQLLPSLEISAHSARVDWTFEKACEGSFSFAQWLTFILPKVFGSWSSPESQAPQFWLKGPFNGYFTYWDTCFYTGFAIFTMAIIQCRYFKKNAFIKFAVVWCIISMSIALGRNFFVYRILFDFVPGFGRFRAPARILFTWNFIVPVFAAYTFDQLSEDNINYNKKFFFVIIGLCSLIGLSVASGVFKLFWPLEMENKKISDFASIQGIILLVNTVFLICPLFLYSQKKISLAGTKWIIIVVLIIDMFIFGSDHHISKQGGADKFYNQAREIKEAVLKESKSEHFRFNMRQFKLDNSPLGNQTGLMILKRNQGMIDRIQLFEGYNPLNLYRKIPPGIGTRHFDRMIDLLNIKYFINPNYSRDSKQLIQINSDRLPRAKMFYSYKIFESDSIVKNFMLTNDYNYQNELLLAEKPEIKIPDKKTGIKNDIEITKYSQNKIQLRVSTEENGMLWLSEIWYPAWKAYVNGKKTKVFCADYSFRAVEIQRGDSTVEFIYQSIFFRYGAIITFLTLLFAGCSFFFHILKNRNVENIISK